MGLGNVPTRALAPSNENRYHLPVCDDPKFPVHRPAADIKGPAPSRTTSQALLGTARELIITHDGREYRLRLTQQGKLILTA